jgi:hypothetical protein
VWWIVGIIAVVLLLLIGSCLVLLALVRSNPGGFIIPSSGAWLSGMITVAVAVARIWLGRGA